MNKENKCHSTTNQNKEQYNDGVDSPMYQGMRTFLDLYFKSFSLIATFHTPQCPFALIDCCYIISNYFWVPTNSWLQVCS